MPNNDAANDNRHMPDWALLATVFITGACVLIIELMGTRILAPYFGSGIYTWSALIAVTLAALALGYAFGGRLADRLPRADILYNLCLAAGLWTLSTPMLARPLLPAMIQIPDLRIGVLLSSCILYFPGLFLLGAIGPFVIRLMTRKRETVGSVSGRVFAVSTIGSLLGALGTGFILIPNFGVLAIFAFCGSLLLALAVVGNFRPKFIGYTLILTCLVVLLLVFTGNRPISKVSVELLQQVPSFYGQLQVIEKNGEKSLLVDGIGQNYVYDNDVYSTEYINFIASLPKIQRKPAASGDKALVVGLGAGQLPMLLQKHGLHVEAVEIDPKVGDMARQHFSLNLPPEQIHYIDGRVFLLRTSEFYEYIILDAFSAEQIAWHLLSVEALTEARTRLTEGGLLAINLTSIAGGRDVAALQHTLQAVFPNVRSFALDQGNELTSVVLLASMSPIDLNPTGVSLADTQLTDVERFLAGELADLHSDVMLSDDYNPISYQRKNIQTLWREAMIDYLGSDNLDWLTL
ncbi:MAG: fused MFS/spermidine synthase [Thiotrichales bacterium]|nr:MAG: fused MFS/spermidine synthase [Thiotrichales bacterium]